MDEIKRRKTRLFSTYSPSLNDEVQTPYLLTCHSHPRRRIGASCRVAESPGQSWNLEWQEYRSHFRRRRIPQRGILPDAREDPQPEIRIQLHRALRHQPGRRLHRPEFPKKHPWNRRTGQSGSYDHRHPIPPASGRSNRQLRSLSRCWQTRHRLPHRHPRIFRRCQDWRF